MTLLWEMRAWYRRADIAHLAAVAATLARISGETVEIETWVRTQAAYYTDPGMQALLLAKVAKSLSAVGRTPGAMDLACEAIFIGRLARRDTMLEVLEDIAPVLRHADRQQELRALVKALDDFRPWLAISRVS